MQKFSYHTHTDFSDGHNTAEEMIQQAVNLGWEEIGISDHLIVHKNMQQSKSWKRWSDNNKTRFFHTEFQPLYDTYLRHNEVVRKVANKYNIKVRIGAEVDFFVYDGWQEEFAEFRRQVDLDYYISGNHFLQLENGNKFIDAKDVNLLDEDELDKAIRFHFSTIKQAAISRIFAFIAHIDYMRKLTICDDNSYINEKLELIKALQESNTATEVSTKGLRKQGYFYPADNILHELIKHSIPVIISDDAHKTSELGFEFLETENYLSQHKSLLRWTFSR